MKKYGINGKVYFLDECIDDWSGLDNFNDTYDYILSTTAFFRVCCTDVVHSTSSEEALEDLALENANKSYYNTIKKLLEKGDYDTLAINIEKYTDCYVLELEFLGDYCGPARNETIKIDSDFSIENNYGFIAVKKRVFKNNRQKAYEFMQGLAKDYKRASELGFYKLTVYNENEEYTSIIDEDLYCELNNEQKIKHVLDENGILQAG